MQQESHRCHGLCFPKAVKSLFPLALQYYLNAFSHSSALSSPQTALKKTRGFWVVCFVLTVSGDFLWFLPKDRLQSFFQKTLILRGKPAPKACVPLYFRWSHLLVVARRREVEVSKAKLLYQSLLPSWVRKFIPSSHQRGQKVLVRITAQEQPKYLECCVFTWVSLLCQGLESPTRTPAVQLVHPADSTSNLLSFRNYLPV